MADLSEYILREVRDLGRRVGHLETLETPISPYTPAAHDIVSAYHTITGAALSVVGATGLNTLGLLTPSSSPGAASAILKSDADGYLTLTKLTSTGQLISQIAVGTAPLVVTSTTVVSNLNADLLDGLHAASYAQIDAVQNVGGNWTFTPSNPGVLPPFATTSAIMVTNLNANYVGGLAAASFAQLNAVQNVGHHWTFDIAAPWTDPPFATNSLVMVTNLNADMVDGSHAAAFEPAQTKGNMTATSPIAVDQTRQVIGGAVVISHVATDGNIHLPSGGTANQLLKNSGTAGTGSWGTVTEAAGVLGAVVAIHPAADSTTAIQIRKADATTAIATLDTTNGRLGIGATPTAALDVRGGTSMASLGSDLVLNGDFSSGTGWTAGTGWSITSPTGYYTFTVSTPSIWPSTGAVYSDGVTNYTVLDYSSTYGVIHVSGAADPDEAASTLSRVSGTGDATITYSAWTPNAAHAAGAGTLTKTLTFTAGAYYQLICDIYTKTASSAASPLKITLGATTIATLGVIAGSHTRFQAIGVPSSGNDLVFTADSTWEGFVGRITICLVTTTTADVAIHTGTASSTPTQMRNLGSGRQNTAIGYLSGLCMTSGTENIGLGYVAISKVTTGVRNMAIGSYCLRSLASGSYNAAVGATALYSLLTGNLNAAIGFSALYTASTSSYCTGIGSYSLESLMQGAYNTAIGFTCARYLVSGEYNTLIGAAACSSGAAYYGMNYTVAIGYQSGQYQQGGYNTFVGAHAGRNTSAQTGTGNVFVGYGAGYYETGSSKLFIDNATRASESDGRVKALLYGEFNATALSQQLTINAGTLNLLDALNIALGTGTGTKIGNSATAKLGLYDATPVVRQNHIADPSGGGTQDAEARSAINSILVALETIGIVKTS